MRILITLLIVSFALLSSAQNPGRVGGSGVNDSNYILGKLRIGNKVYLTNLANSDSNKVLGIDGNGLLTLRTKSSGGGSGTLTGTGTANYASKFTAPTVLGNSSMWDSNGRVGINTSSPTHALHVVGNIRDIGISGNGIRTVITDDSGVLKVGPAVSLFDVPSPDITEGEINTPSIVSYRGFPVASTLGAKHHVLYTEAPNHNSTAYVMHTVYNGKWSVPDTVINTMDVAGYSSGIGPGGRIIVPYNKIGANTFAVRYSDDSGATWVNAPAQAQPAFPGDTLVIFGKGKLMQNGEYHVGAYSIKNKVVLLKSLDSGKTFSVKSYIDTGVLMNEMGFAQAPNGSIIYVIRPAAGSISRVYRSDNGGSTITYTGNFSARLSTTTYAYPSEVAYYGDKVEITIGYRGNSAGKLMTFVCDTGVIRDISKLAANPRVYDFKPEADNTARGYNPYDWGYASVVQAGSGNKYAILYDGATAQDGTIIRVNKLSDQNYAAFSGSAIVQINFNSDPFHYQRDGHIMQSDGGGFVAKDSVGFIEIPEDGTYEVTIKGTCGDDITGSERIVGIAVQGRLRNPVNDLAYINKEIVRSQVKFGSTERMGSYTLTGITLYAKKGEFLVPKFYHNSADAIRFFPDYPVQFTYEIRIEKK